MAQWLIELSYVGMFMSAFLAATILPFSSEVVLAALLVNDGNPGALVFIASLGNVLGAVTNYLIGLYGGPVAARRLLKLDAEAIEKARLRFSRYGLWALSLSWVPVIGDPITVLAGVLRVPWPWFFLIVTVAKAGRYIVLSSILLAAS